MTYTLQAFVGEPRLLSGGGDLSVVVPLSLGMALLPLRESFRKAHGIPFLPFTDGGAAAIPESLAVLGGSLSRHGRVAYVEAQFSGGVGTQASVVWEGESLLQPLLVAADAINGALRLLGVDASGRRDEFSAVELGRQRDTEAWTADLEVRVATARDAAALQYLNRCFNGVDTPVEWVERALGGDGGGETTVVATVGEQAVGFGCLRVSRSACYVMPAGEVTELFVLPEWRRRGTARSILARLVDEARRAGAGELFVVTNEGNAAARTLYSTLRFVEGPDVVLRLAKLDEPTDKDLRDKAALNARSGVELPPHVRRTAGAPVLVRGLLPSDAGAYQALRLRGLRECPTAFASSFEEERETSLAVVAERLAARPDRAHFGAFADAALVGVVSIQREGLRKLAHKALLWGMYVPPEHRKQGVGRRLVGEALAWAFAQPGVRQVTLGVNAANGPAISLYEAMGFRTFGLERGFALVDGALQDELHMVRFASEGVPLGLHVYRR